jgi:hypothetical protein
MSKFLLTVLLPVIISSAVLCQYNPGARQIALANSDVGQADDVFAVFSNPGGLSRMKRREVGIYYSPAPFGFKELANGFLAYQEPFKFGSIGIGAMTYGFDLYRESKVIIGFSHSFRNIFFAGISASYHNVSIKKYGSAGTFYIDLGGIWYLNDFIRWGFSVNNLNHASFAGSDDQIPVIMNTGISTDIMGDFTLNAALEKDIRYNASMKFGFEYSPIRYISVRSGFSNEPSRFTAGIGINYSFIKLDYAVFTHNDLGLTHQAGLIIDFGSDEPEDTKQSKTAGLN